MRRLDARQLTDLAGSARYAACSITAGLFIPSSRAMAETAEWIAGTSGTGAATFSGSAQPHRSALGGEAILSCRLIDLTQAEWVARYRWLDAR
jgi:hypothetical protein